MAARRLRIAIGVVAIIVIAAGATVVIVFSQYVTTESADATTAAKAFAAARGQITAPTALIEYGDMPVVHRDETSPRRALQTINVLVYDADEGQLKHLVIPAQVVQRATLGGRIRVMNLGAFGDSRDRVTLEDLERHGPGLVLDTSIAAVPTVAVANLVLGRKTSGSRIMIWTK